MKIVYLALSFISFCFSQQPDLAMGQTFADVCPLLDQPSPGMNYQQPVLINQDIELVTRNLPPEVWLCMIL